MHQEHRSFLALMGRLDRKDNSSNPMSGRSQNGPLLAETSLFILPFPYCLFPFFPIQSICTKDINTINMKGVTHVSIRCEKQEAHIRATGR